MSMSLLPVSLISNANDVSNAADLRYGTPDGVTQIAIRATAEPHLWSYEVLAAGQDTRLARGTSGSLIGHRRDMARRAAEILTPSVQAMFN